MSDIAVLVPVLNRPKNAAALAESLAASTDRARLLFVVSMADSDAQFDACAATGAEVLSVEWKPGRADFARKQNAGYAATTEPLVLLGADDLTFHPGWLEAVEAVAAEYDVGVIGTNDLANGAVLAGRHSTHPVVTRCYIDSLGGTFDETPGVVYSEAYSHQLVDNELCAVAQARGCYAHAHDARVEHRHPLWGSAPMGATYRKALADGDADRRLFREREKAWRARVAV